MSVYKQYTAIQVILIVFFYINFSKDLKILTTSRHLVHFNLQMALGLTQIVFLVGGAAKHNEVSSETGNNRME